LLFVNSLNRLIKSGEERSVNIKKNIIISFLIRALSLVINFSIVPLTIQYVDSVRYGIWLTLASIISWFTFFDFGMGNGLRNKLATAFAYNDHNKAKKYISTTYAIFVLIGLLVFLLFYFINPYVNWTHLLNIPSGVNEDIHLVLLIVLGTFCVQFILQLINTVLISLQQSAKAEFITLLGQVGLLITLFFLKYNVKGSLTILVVALNVAPMAILLLSSLLLYSAKLRILAPSLKYIDFRHSKGILNLGGAFFLIQIGALILYQTDNFIIAKVIGPEAVTKFNVAHKLYSVIIMAFSIIIMPYWSAFTEAFAKKDFEWITRSVKRLREIWFFIAFIVVPVFFFLAKFLFKIWLQDAVEIDRSLSLLMAIYVICYTCLTLNCYFLNGIGKLRVQLVLYLFVIITNVPLGIVMCKWWGLEGVVIANIISFIFMNSILWIQTNKILRHRATGIWNS
jgi:O-antigen/teichoic acid export membrane protein